MRECNRSLKLEFSRNVSGIEGCDARMGIAVRKIQSSSGYNLRKNSVSCDAEIVMSVVNNSW